MNLDTDLGYPNSKREGAKKLRNIFLNSIDPRISGKILDTERTMEVTTEKKYRMPFDSILSLAVKIERDLEKRQKSVSWVRPQTIQIEEDCKTLQQRDARVFSNNNNRGGVKPKTSNLCKTTNRCHMSLLLEFWSYTERLLESLKKLPHLW